MIRKTTMAILIALTVIITVPTTIYALEETATFEEFCDVKTSNSKLSAADFICELDIFQMKADITDLQDRVTALEPTVIPDPPILPIGSGYERVSQLTIDDRTFDVLYNATTAITGIEADTDFISLIVSYNPPTDEILVMQLERVMIDFISDGSDDDFTVLVDGDEPTFVESFQNSTHRVLTMNIQSGSEEIEIVGSVMYRSP